MNWTNKPRNNQAIYKVLIKQKNIKKNQLRKKIKIFITFLIIKTSLNDTFLNIFHNI